VEKIKTIVVSTESRSARFGRGGTQHFRPYTPHPACMAAPPRWHAGHSLVLPSSERAAGADRPALFRSVLCWPAGIQVAQERARLVLPGIPSVGTARLGSGRSVATKAEDPPLLSYFVHGEIRVFRLWLVRPIGPN
jgi:hypothetical protein